MLGNIGTFELIVIAVVMFILFGGKKLPELARGITEAGKEFNKGLNQEDSQHTDKAAKKDKQTNA